MMIISLLNICDSKSLPHQKWSPTSLYSAISNCDLKFAQNDSLKSHEEKMLFKCPNCTEHSNNWHLKAHKTCLSRAYTTYSITYIHSAWKKEAAPVQWNDSSVIFKVFNIV